MELCHVTGIVRRADGAPAANIRGKVIKALLGGAAISTATLRIHTDAGGVLKSRASDGTEQDGFHLPQGARAWISLPVHGFADSEGFASERGTERLIPDAPTVDFNNLVPPFGASSTAATQAALNSLASTLAAQLALHSETIDADAVLDIGDSLRALILIDTSTADVTATLPPVSEMSGRSIVLKKIADANTAIVDGAGAELIDGALVFNLGMENEFIEVSPASGAWRIVGKG